MRFLGRVNYAIGIVAFSHGIDRSTPEPVSWSFLAAGIVAITLGAALWEWTK